VHRHESEKYFSITGRLMNLYLKVENGMGVLKEILCAIHNNAAIILWFIHKKYCTKNCNLLISEK
jgi:hypothetical protein